MKKNYDLPYTIYHCKCSCFDKFKKLIKANNQWPIINGQHEGGFTLVEILLYAGLLMILLVVLLQIFSSLIDVQLSSESSSSVTQDGQYILSRLSYDIGQATAVSSPSSLATSSSSLTLTSSGVPTIFSVSSGNLMSGSVNLNSYATSVSNFSVERIQSANGIDSLSISFTLTSKTKPVAGPTTENFKSTFTLRKP